MAEQVTQRIESIIKSDRVVLFMKGTRDQPRCGFSAGVIQILNGLVPSYSTVDVLADPDIRQGIKDYSNWPTIPQLYIDGEFVGGGDIVREMHASGDLHRALGVTPEKVEPPSIEITPAAAEAFRAATGELAPGEGIHLAIDETYDHSLGVGPRSPTDIAVEAGGVTLLLDLMSAKRAGGVSIDYVTGAGGEGFKIENPNAPPPVEEIGPAELQRKLEAGEIAALYDVRPPSERERASIEGARPLDDEAVRHLENLDKDTPLAFHCHHGHRSQAAAEHFRQKGFRKLYNLAGGIDAWSREVDGSVPRY
jgi:monothiol glutaredoxin